jgi:hypothetical protein
MSQCSKMMLRWLKMILRWFKMLVHWLKMIPRWLKMVPCWLKMLVRWLKMTQTHVYDLSVLYLYMTKWLGINVICMHPVHSSSNWCVPVLSSSILFIPVLSTFFGFILPSLMLYSLFYIHKHYIIPVRRMYCTLRQNYFKLFFVDLLLSSF